MAPGRGSDLLDAGDALVAGATVAGDDGFCELAAVAEEQWVLSGEAVPRSLVVDNDQWESRAALNAYLAGMDRAEFEKAARFDIELWFWESPENIRLLNSPAPARDIASGLAQSKTIMDSGSRWC
jgi:hypothetical protein